MTFRQLLLEANTSNISINMSFLQKILDKNMSIKELQKVIKKNIKIKEVSFNLVKTKSVHILAVSGEYASDIDEENDGDDSEPVIIINILYNEDSLTLTKDLIDYLSVEIPNTINHEMIHLQQARKRMWTSQKTYYPKNHDKAYLSNDDEIEAYAQDIVKELLSTMPKNKVEEVLKQGTAKKFSIRLKEYIDLFGTEHTVTKKLLKKVIYYLNN